MTRPGISAASTRPPLRRAIDDRLLLGVCAGIARSLGRAPRAIRLFAVALAAVAAPLALGLYVVLAAIVPRGDGRALLGGAPADGRESLVGWSLIAVTSIWFAAEEFRLGGLVWPALSSFGVFAAAASALVLLALAQRREAMPGPDMTAAVADEDRARGDATITDERTAEGGAPRAPRAHATPGTGLGGATAPEPDAPTARFAPPDTAVDGDAASPQFVQPPRPPRRGPSVAVIGFGVLLIAAAGVFLLDATGQVDLSAAAVAVGLGAGTALPAPARSRAPSRTAAA